MIKPTKSFEPKIHESCYIADEGLVIGNVTIKEKGNIWPFAVVRGDVNSIEIGRYSNIQDGAIIHVSSKYKTVIGDYVTVGHGAKLHGCTVMNNVLVGIGAIILDGAEIGEGSIVAAGTIIPPGKKVPPNMVAIGNPYKIIRAVNDEEKLHNIDTCTRYGDIYPNEMI